MCGVRCGAQERQGLQSHPDLVQALGWVDLQAGARAAGGRGFFLLSDGVMLNQVRPPPAPAAAAGQAHCCARFVQTCVHGRATSWWDVAARCPQALAAYGLEFLRSRGWTPVQTPYWLLGSVMSRCAQLAQFDEELYR